MLIEGKKTQYLKPKTDSAKQNDFVNIQYIILIFLFLIVIYNLIFDLQ